VPNPRLRPVVLAILLIVAAAVTARAQDPPPLITSVGPSSGPKEGGTTVFINGSGFTAGVAVTFGGTPAASVTLSSPTSVRAVTPVSPIGSGAVTVRVQNLDGQFAERANGFTYLTLQPAISNVVPYYAPEAGGTVVTINGMNLNLDPAARFTFGGVDAVVQTLTPRWWCRLTRRDWWTSASSSPMDARTRSSSSSCTARLRPSAIPARWNG